MKEFSYLYFTSIIFFSCNNRGESEQEKILSKFDSVNRELTTQPLPDSSGNKGIGDFRSITQVFGYRQRLYDSILKKLEGTERIKLVMQMNYEVGEFYKNLQDLKERFFIACGDPAGRELPEKAKEDITMTNRFFKTAPATYLLSWLLPAKKTLVENTGSDSIRKVVKNIGKLGEYRSSYTAEYWADKYFKNTAPVAAITILNSFEWEIKNVEVRILSDYLK